jgi:hypothetical protein
MNSSPAFLLLCIALTLNAPAVQAQSTDSLWSEFLGSLYKGEMTADRLRPLTPSLTGPLLGYLQTIRTSVPRESLPDHPESHSVGEYIHYIVPIVDRTDTSIFCFTLMIDRSGWYFRHLENILLRLDTLSHFPVSSYPTIPETQKAWMREEKYWSQIVHLYTMFKKDGGPPRALEMFRDGAGYFLEAKSWVPLVAPERAFILYLAWEQSQLRGGNVTITHLDDSTASIDATPFFFQLYIENGPSQRTDLARRVSCIVRVSLAGSRPECRLGMFAIVSIG